MFRFWIRVCLLGLVLALLPDPASAQTAHVLERMRRIPGTQETVLRFELDSPAPSTVNRLGQRIVVRFERTEPAEGLAELSTGGDVVRSRVMTVGLQTEVTILLRRPPQDVETLTSPDDPVVRVVLNWPQQGRWTRPGITDDPQGDLAVVRQGTVAGHYLRSRYAGQWETFFRTYAAPVRPQAEMRPSLMPFSVLVPGLETTEIPFTALNAAQHRKWEETVGALTPDSTNATAPSRDLLAAQAYLATQRPGRALAHLERVPKPASLQNARDVRRTYLFLRTLLALDRVHLAWADYSETTLPEATSPAMRLYWRVLGAELGLAAGQPQQALALLDEAPLAGERSVRLVAARRLHLLYELNRLEEAWQVSRKTVLPLEFVRRMPAVVERLADLLYRRGEYGQAMRMYNALADSLSAPEPKSLALWRMGMSLRYSGQPKGAERVMELILDKWPESAGGYRARVARNDLAVLENLGELKPSHVTAYDKVADTAPQRRVREEAALKRILVMREMGERRRAVQWLSDFLTDFGAGGLRGHARVLLGELLPPVVNNLLDQGDAVRGLALVAEHRDTLVRTEMPQPFLERVGDTFEELGLYERAARVFLYMLAESRDNQRRQLLLPRVVRLWTHMGDAVRATQYAEVYLQEFPQGGKRAAVIRDAASTLIESGNAAEALDWLLDPERPVDRRLDVLTARALYAVEALERMDRYLERSVLVEHMLSARTRFVWADSLTRRNRYERALPIWRSLFGDPGFGTRALYTGASCLEQLGRTREAAKLYDRLAEKTESPVWRKMAEESRALSRVEAFLSGRE